MQSDKDNRYRSILENDLPEFVSRVNTPWDNLPDYADFNSAAYRLITRDLERIRKSCREGRPTSRGILILGEAGSGKTHLLMRVANNLAKTNQILFVRRPNDEEAVGQHVWAEIVRSLARDVPTSGTKRNQLDDLLAHVFFSVLLPEFERDERDGKITARSQRWAEALRADPYNVFEMLGEGETRSAEMKSIRNRTLRYLQQKHPEIDQQIAYALITYCFVSSELNKRIILNWLSGQEIDEKESERMGLPAQWVDVEDDSLDVSIQQQREERALRAIQTIGILSTYFQPLILAFDQLEGLRNEKRLTERWGNVVREIFTMAPNFLIVTCIFPTLWEQWFEQVLDESAAQRLSEQRVHLEQFSHQHAQRLLEKHMETTFQRHRLPTSIYPFAPSDVTELCTAAKSPRQFIQAAKTAFNSWLDQDINSSAACADQATSMEFASADVDSALWNAFERFQEIRRQAYSTEITTENDFFGMIRVLLAILTRDESIEYDKAIWGHFVMPTNIVLRSRRHGDQLCIAVLNGGRRAFTARIRNIISAFHDGEQFTQVILMRDLRCDSPSGKSKEYLSQLARKGGKFVSIDAEEHVLLSALYDTLIAIEEKSIAVGTNIVDEARFAQFLRDSGLANKSTVIRSIATQAACIEEALNNGAAFTQSESTIATFDQFTALEPITNYRDGNCSLEQTAEPEENVPHDYVHDDLRWRDESSNTAVLTRIPRAPTATSSECYTTNRTSAHVAPQAMGNPPKFDALIGESKLETSHAGVLGRLRDSNQVLGISLKKPQCIVLLGYMGSGKSYALGVLMENALLQSSPIVRSSRPMTVVAFNYRRNSSARFEYHGFAEPNHRAEETDALLAKYSALPSSVDAINIFGYGPELKRRQADYHDLPTYPIQFRPDELSAEHWSILMKPPTAQAEYMDVVRDIIQQLYDEERLTYRNLERMIQEDDRLSSSQQRRAKNRLDFAKKWLADDRPYQWSDVLVEGTLNVFDLRMQTLHGEEALKLCLVLTDLIRRTKNRVNKLIVFDEAHEYVDSKQLVGDLENALTQIRHDGLSFVVASQFPERIPENILKFMGTRFIFQLPTAKAINHLKNASPNLKNLSLKQVANLGLERGICFVQTDDQCTDISLRTPQLLEIRPRCTLHGGATVRHIG